MTSYTYFLSSDINLDIKVCIKWVEGVKAVDIFEQRLCPDYNPTTYTSNTELYIHCQLYSNGCPVGLPVSTPYKCFSDPKKCLFNEWLTIPMKYRDLTPSCQLVFTIWDVMPPREPPSGNLGRIGSGNATTHSSATKKPVGGVTVPLFDKNDVLLYGRHKLNMYAAKEGDGRISSSTLQKVKVLNNYEKLEQLMHKKRLHQDIPSVGWLDKISHRRIDRMNKNREKSTDLRLVIEFPNFKHKVVFHQKQINTIPTDITHKHHKHDRGDNIFFLYDPEVEQENPIELKYLKLDRNSDGYGVKMKVNERDEVERILKSPEKKLTTGEKRLLWKFRFTLIGDRRALTKFLRSVDWRDDKETKQALNLMKDWAPIDIADALELLSNDFKNVQVRQYGLQTLKRADDDEFICYLLHLVQALRYEDDYPNDLSRFLIDRVMTRFDLVNFFYWYLRVATEDKDRKTREMYKAVLAKFLEVLNNHREFPERTEYAEQLIRQESLVKDLLHLSNEMKTQKGRADRKTERLRWVLTEGDMSGLQHFNLPVKLPVRPSVVVTGIIPSDAHVFKSALGPMGLNFKTEHAPPYKIIFKTGDDLRQDQLMLQMIGLMDSLLKQVKLDLKLTAYGTLATSPNDGFVDFVPNSQTLASVLKNHNGNIKEFFLAHHQTKEIGEVLNTFVKSSAGYCVITYILGIGDRHLDNLLLTKSGRLFHIDFGFVFGKDPKPLPPPMKLCKEMVEAMGGNDSAHYRQFEIYCCQAFNILRQNATLILNLLGLVGESFLPSLDIREGLKLVQTNFQLDLSDEEAEQYFLTLIHDSVNALFPKVAEQIHKWVAYWR